MLWPFPSPERAVAASLRHPRKRPPVHEGGDNVGTSGARLRETLCTSCARRNLSENFPETPCAPWRNRHRTTPPQSETAGQPEATPDGGELGDQPTERPGEERRGIRTARRRPTSGQPGTAAQRETAAATGTTSSSAGAEHDGGPPGATWDGGAAGDRGGDGHVGVRGTSRKAKQVRGATRAGGAGDRADGAPAGPTSAAPSATTRSAEGDLRRRRSGRPRRRRGRAGSSVHADDERRAIGATRRRRSGRPRCRRARRTRRRPPMRSADRLGRPGSGAKRGQPRDATRSDGRTAAQKVDLAVGATRPQAGRMCIAGPLDLIHRGAPHHVPVCQAQAPQPASDTARVCDLPHTARMRARPGALTVPA